MSEKWNSTCRCECEGKTRCGMHIDANAHFMKCIVDVATSLADVMVTCGIHECKAKGSMKVTIQAFLHYNGLRHEEEPRAWRSMCRDSVLQQLKTDSLMNDTEAQLAYYIIKQGFKAYYFGTAHSIIHNPVVEAEAIFSQEPAFTHSACRTVQIFANYELLFPNANRRYAKAIRQIYTELFKKLQQRALAMQEAHRCNCKCRTMKSPDKCCFEAAKKPSQLDSGSAAGLPISCSYAETEAKTCRDALQVIYKYYSNKEAAPGENPNVWSKISLYVPRCLKCEEPQMICKCMVDPKTGIAMGNFGQPPYDCKWKRIGEDDELVGAEEESEERGTQPRLPLACGERNHECPIDCTDISWHNSDSEPETCRCESCDDEHNSANNMVDSETEMLDELVIASKCHCGRGSNISTISREAIQQISYDIASRKKQKSKSCPCKVPRSQVPRTTKKKRIAPKKIVCKKCPKYTEIEPFADCREYYCKFIKEIAARTTSKKKKRRMLKKPINYTFTKK